MAGGCGDKDGDGIAAAREKKDQKQKMNSLKGF